MGKVPATQHINVLAPSGNPLLITTGRANACDALPPATAQISGDTLIKDAAIAPKTYF
jgi:hypothetical protein